MRTALRRLTRALRPYLPNRSAKLALVPAAGPFPHRAQQRVVLTQLVGGRTWSLSLVRHAGTPQLLPGQED